MLHVTIKLHTGCKKKGDINFANDPRLGKRDSKKRNEKGRKEIEI